MSRLLRLLLAFTLMLNTLPLTALLSARTAYALDSGGVTEVVTSLQSLGTVVNSLSGLAGLGEPIPFTDIDPSEALNLDTLFTDALGALGAPSSLAALAAVIDGKDNPNLGGTGIAVQFNNVVGNDTANTLAFDFVATRTMNVPLSFTEWRRQSRWFGHFPDLPAQCALCPWLRWRRSQPQRKGLPDQRTHDRRHSVGQCSRPHRVREPTRLHQRQCRRQPGAERGHRFSLRRPGQQRTPDRGRVVVDSPGRPGDGGLCGCRGRRHQRQPDARCLHHSRPAGCLCRLGGSHR